MFNLFSKFAFWHLQTRPKVDIGKCIGCAACVSKCPSEAIRMFPWIPNVELPPKTGEPRLRPEINHQRCNRCYDCIKNCSRSAIETFKPVLMKLFRFTH